MNKASDEQMLCIEALTLDAKTQCRQGTSEETVEDYAEALETRGEWCFGPIDVFTDGVAYYVADGFHRTLAAKRMSYESVPCRIHTGTARDARIFGMTANDRHGLRMSRADKRNCVVWLLQDSEKRPMTEVAKLAGVTYRTVMRISAELRGAPKPAAKTPVTKSHTDSPSDTSDDSEAVVLSDNDDVPFSAPGESKPKPSSANDSPQEHARKLRSAFEQHLGHAIRLVDAMHEVRANARQHEIVINQLRAIQLW